MEVGRARRRAGRWLAASLVLAVLAVPAGASANDHLIKIREVFAGAPGATGAQFVEAQMTNANQTMLAGNEVHVYDETNTVLDTFVFPSNVAGGANQSSLLVATPEAATFFGVTPDLTMTAVIPGDGGKVCYEDIDGAMTMGLRDCASWGSFSGDPNGDDGIAGTLDDTGNPFGPLAGIEPGHAMLRDISAGNPALLETADDTNDSAADFDDSAAPSPRTNGGATTTTAGSAAVVAGALDFDAAAGVANQVKLSKPAAGTIGLADSAAPVTAGAGCSQFRVNEVHCPLALGSTADLSLGDQVDRLTATSGYDVDVDAGAGNDRITLKNGDDTVTGGDGNDMLTPGEGADLVDGEAGADTASYADRGPADPVAVDLDDNPDDGNADDGPAGARDNILATVERLIGGGSDDVLVGSNVANRITGGAGVDTMQGAGRNDVIFADETPDPTFNDDILCGLGANDHVFVNVGDNFPTSGSENCELVN